ncbi:hypothetical protein [Antarcticimicrobium sediminis]|uniref:Fenitrothion hydrolase n=1 Tax=Antarcticimicrobium sediminis TaxID=2546227 RepID=A0A4R5ESL9_9RHOB|nr:hypothetical protein [Antarcticimicrobium sediminis]TDE37839.1 hypothetical protein E1B25_10440 [Antarcticimicrobium sediminis]
MARIALAAGLVVAGAGAALAHATEGGLVLLLPTDVYTAAGAAAVALTVVLMAVLPERVASWLFTPLTLVPLPLTRLPQITSMLVALVFLSLVWTGLSGPRDPMENPLTLGIWTGFWIILVTVQGLAFDIWRWVNPWLGPAAMLRGLGVRQMLPLPVRLGYAPAILTFLAFAAFLMADPAPADPERLARFGGLYWLLNLVAVLVFGPRWLGRGEGITLLMRSYARMSIMTRRAGRLALGLSGWQVLRTRVPRGGWAGFMLVILACGSFDGVNETFWWLNVLGLNPLEFPGRSAVVWQNLAGLLAANVLLVAIFAATIKAGLLLNQSPLKLREAVRLFAPTILPIALGYHIAHYYSAFLVEGQYLWVMIEGLVGIPHEGPGHAHHITTGFFNTTDSMRRIWLTQAGAVVLGHVTAVILAHAVALRVFGTARRALLSQAPLALFMIAYTFFGLWLLASPRGL